jgi:hypothetical protein
MPPSDRTAFLLRISTTIIFVLLGLGAYLLAAVVGSGAPQVVLQSLGGFLIGTVVVSYAYEYFLREETENRTVAKLDDVLGRRVDGIFPGATQYGFNGFATEAPRNSFDALEEGDELLWLDTYSPDLMLFTPKLQSALERGAMVRMLMIDPTAQTTTMRAEEIAEAGYDPSHFSEGAANFFDVVVSAAKQLHSPSGKLEIRRFSDLPCVPMYLRLRDGRPISGVTGYFLSEASFNTVHIRWSAASGGMLAGFHRYFERKWNCCPAAFDSSGANRATDQAARPSA